MSELIFKDVSVAYPLYSGKKKLFSFVNPTRQKEIFLALDKVSFELKDGDRLGIFGRNGAGKTTLLRVATHFLPPTSGIVTSQGEISSLLEVGAGMNNNISGRENLKFRARLEGVRKDAESELIENIIEFAQLREFVDQPMRTYSAGMKLRLAFGLATSLRPDILIMDEWLSVGDGMFKEAAKQKMEKLFQSATIVVLASHSKSLIEQNCNVFLWLEHGKSKYLGRDPRILDEYFSDRPS